MTAQIPDSFLFQGKKISTVGVHGGTLFNPLDHGMQPLPRITSCRRGYVCTYKTSGRKLLLDILQVNLGRDGPAIDHVRPAFSNSGMFDNTYTNLNQPPVPAESPPSHRDAARGRNGLQPGRDRIHVQTGRWEFR